MFTRLVKNAATCSLFSNFMGNCVNPYCGKRLFSGVTTKSTCTTTSNAFLTSTFDKLYTYANPMEVKGIWRAPRQLVFSKEQFDKAYPEGYHGMRIGLPPKDSWMAKYIDPKYDSISPFLWTILFISPILYYSIVHSLWEIGLLPSKSHSH
ncbi:conserved Plasmodium protein, unknown function [Babesia microti strain RI]|uniref:Uncharacterized protein n=1 Tax=Babesia microti (strain RI) TaxID=1133968 RepID=I7IQJ3_BABMR|nr:conserved Plasmodium protein, unknown function [Babesia microti strain RI]CCF73830.1 conserved Plasmodium protein, unknown function [Babesia microti strain RI]|eukprot:XP_012648439.1 conserved Plasmodium protein, unknown function [Babesia microti strain RI]